MVGRLQFLVLLVHTAVMVFMVHVQRYPLYLLLLCLHLISPPWVLNGALVGR